MNETRKLIYGFWIAFLGTISCTYAQEPLHVGDTLPSSEFEWLTSIYADEFPDTSGSHRLYLLDFWSTGCSSCMEAFPKMEALQRQFAGNIKIVAINPWQDEAKVAAYMAKSRHYQMTTLPSSSGDSVWRLLFPTQTVPHHVWLDSLGKVLAITSGYNATVKHIKSYLNGELPRMILKPRGDKFDLQAFSLKELLGTDALPYRDGYICAGPLYEGEGGQVYGYQQFDVVDSVNRTIRYSFVNTTFFDLYRCAWMLQPDAPLGRARNQWSRPDDIPEHRMVWEISVPEYYLRTTDYDQFDDWSRRTKFCVEFTIPLEKAAESSDLLFEGLNRYFSQTLGVSAALESRNRPCLVVKRIESDKPLVSDNGEASQDYDEVNHLMKLNNMPFELVFAQYLNSVVNAYSPFQGYPFKPIALVDETGIDGKVAIEIHEVSADEGDPVDVLNARLKDTGLTVEKATREIQMLVITDKVVKAD